MAARSSDRPEARPDCGRWPDPKRGPADAFVSPQIHLLIFDAAPQSLDENIVAPSPFSVHADRNVDVGEHAGEGRAGELRTLICIEDLRFAVTSHPRCEGRYRSRRSSLLSRDSRQRASRGLDRGDPDRVQHRRRPGAPPICGLSGRSSRASASLKRNPCRGRTAADGQQRQRVRASDIEPSPYRRRPAMFSPSTIDAVRAARRSVPDRRIVTASGTAQRGWARKGHCDDAAVIGGRCEPRGARRVVFGRPLLAVIGVSKLIRTARAAVPTSATSETFSRRRLRAQELLKGS